MRDHEDGDCFPVAANLFLNDYDRPQAWLVHGQPLGQAGNAAGLRHWHAWVEHEQTLDFPLPDGSFCTVTLIQVDDRANGRTVKLPQSAYYSIGRIETVRRYDHPKVIRLLLETGHYGPWEEEGTS